MTATEELRRLLDERGVKWGTGFGDDTFWTGRHGIEWRWDKQEGILAMFSHAITTEQAIEATLGRGECRNIYDSGSFKCSECGHFTMTKMVYRDGTPATPRYCPWCGRKVVEL